MKTADLALWLAKHVTAIASDQGAHVCYREIRQITVDIERLVDRPTPPTSYGQCPTVLTDNYGERICNAELIVAPGAKSIQCGGCQATRTVDELIELRLADPYALYTSWQVLLVMASDHVREPIAESTWRRWRAMGQVKPAGELYGEPAYRIEDVRNFRRKWTREKAS